MGVLYRFGGVEFDASTGDLRPLGRRLPRQPARLLALLIEKRGEVVRHDEIRATLWNDAAVEYDKSLHFCIHQIRNALGDSANEPRFIQTIPRQGYRLIPQVEAIAEPASTLPAHDRTSILRRWWIPAVVVAVAIAGWALLSRVDGGPPVVESRRWRIGVMPFRPPSGWTQGEVPQIAEWVLEELTNAATGQAWIVGPTTTADYDRPGRSLSELAEAYDLDYVVNGRFLGDVDPPAMLAELVRTADGAHIWVKRYDVLDDGRRIGREIGTEVLEQLRSTGRVVL